MTGPGTITFFAVYWRAGDITTYPVVVRPHRISPAVPGVLATGPIACLCASLGEARDGLARLGCVRFERSPEDDPVLVETWMQ